MLPWPGKVELKLHLKETNASFPQELSSEWEQKERSVKVDIMVDLCHTMIMMITAIGFLFSAAFKVLDPLSRTYV